MFYVIETKYVGPNQDQHVDYDKIVISVTPAEHNMSHEVCLEGWCGNTNDHAVFAYGAFDSIEAARAVITSNFGDVRSTTPDGDTWPSLDQDEIEIYKPGKYAPLSREETGNWIYAGIQEDLTAHTTNERISELAAEYESLANDVGFTLHSDLISLIEEYREQFRYEAEIDD